MHFTLILHIDDVQCGASSWLLTISAIVIVIQPITSSANPSHHLMGVGGGGGAVGGEESLFVGKTAVVANWQTDLLSCLRA